jgi:DNA repair protein RecO (recombination protein O)
LQVEAFVLKKIKTGESDLILHLLTSEGKKVSVFAKCALKSKKRFAGILEPSHLIQAEVRFHQDLNKLSKLQEALLVDDFIKIRTSYDKLHLALRIVESIGTVAQAQDQNENLFVLLKNSLYGLVQAENLEVYFIQYVLKFFYQQGVLERKLWMDIYLKTPLSESYQIKVENFEEITSYEDWCRSELKEYLHRAERSSI